MRCDGRLDLGVLLVAATTSIPEAVVTLAVVRLAPARRATGLAAARYAGQRMAVPASVSSPVCMAKA